MSRYPAPVEQRLWNRVDMSGGPDVCWEWQGAINSHGYGTIRERCASKGCHVIAFRSMRGPVPRGMNRKCCNPKHLFLGTALDNNRDRATKGRNNSARGEATGHAKLTPRDVALIRHLVECGARQRPLCKLFGVTQMSINAIVHRRAWAHVPDLQMPEVRS